MKQCPICQSWAFDDAGTCYGCLHKFTGEEPLPAPAREGASGDVPPAFLIKIRPEREGSGLVSWTCAVELVPA